MEASRSTSACRAFGGSGGPVNDLTYKYCRLCGVELKSGVCIYGEEGRGLQLADKIRKTLSILVLEEDALPKKICTDCCINLEEFSKYKDAVVDAQSKLKAIAQSASAQSPNHSQPQVGQSQPQGAASLRQSNSDDRTPAASSPNAGLISPLSSSARSVVSEAGVNSSAASKNGRMNAGYANSSVQSPNQEEDVIELHIPSPTPSEEPRLVQEDGHGKSPPSVPSAHETGPDSAVASTSQQARNNVPASSSSRDVPKSAKENKSVYHCSQCNKTVSSQAGYYHHISVVHKRRRFPCALCENTYCSKASLKHHEQSVHVDVATSSVQSPTASSSTTVAPPGQFKCPECPKSFRTKKRWSEHKKIHTSLRSFECTVCHKFFKTSKCLRNHMQYHEESRRTYSCPTCDKQFTKSKYLEEHKKLHSDKKLACPFCSHTFNGFPNYVKHTRRKHPEKIGADGKIPKALQANKEPVGGLGSCREEAASSRQAQKVSPTATSQTVPNSQAEPLASTSYSQHNMVSIPPPSHVSPTRTNQHQVENQSNGWMEAVKPASINHANQAQIVRVQAAQQPYSTNTNLQSPQNQNQIQQHHSIPIIPMDDMVDSVIQTALLSHSHPQALDSSSQPNGQNHTPTMQAYNGQHNHNHRSQGQGMMSYMRQFDETPLELCVRSNEEDSTGENEADKGNGYNQLVDLTSAKIVDLSGVGLVMAAAASSSNSTASSHNGSSSMIYRTPNQQQQMSTMSIVQMSMLPIDLTDQHQVSDGMDHMPLSLTSNQNQSANQNNSTMMNSNLVDLSYTGTSNSNRTNNHFQMHHQSQQQQDEQLTSSFLRDVRELLDLSCSNSTTRAGASTSTSMDTFTQQQQQHIHQQNHFQPQQGYQQQQTQYQQSPQHQIQQYELNLSSKSRGYGMGQYQGNQGGQGQSSQGQTQNQTQATMYQHQHSQPLGLANSNGNSARSHTANANSSGNSSSASVASATTNQFHNVMYNDTLFM